ncbi:unnamed protein product [Rotaria socialis]|uniref:Ig-like domain-containing protein n=2 Tax=Rotaria socialis TaxID=392032 RepID=A0A817Z4N2_9BILA|nr:unnamed protein product [Rotaria socialis]CAF3387495.1 unnamed protein product [Rotaria socialis]CAF4182354.1 unnamed protein product [Rotaria socialis]CAF4232849.1 unnamed protein product [Rotaria socialis]
MNPILFVLLFVFLESIIARGPPVLLKQTPNLIAVEINENEPLELHCPVTVTSDLSVQWSKNNEDLDPMWTTANLLIKRFLLKIHRVHVTDAGLYKCNVVNGFGSVQAQFQVNVKSNETSSNSILSNEEESVIVWDVKSFNGEPPKFLSRNDRSKIESTKVIQPEGTTVQLKCLASGKPTPEIRWKKNGKILSEDEFGITQSQILNIKDLRQSDTGNYTCELFNSYGTINSTYILIVTERLQFFGNDPQNLTVEVGQVAILNCRVQTNDPMTKIYWLKKIENQQLFRPDSIVFGSEQYETIEQPIKQQYLNNILSKPLVFPRIHINDSGQYICLIQNDKATNYKTASINIINIHEGKMTPTNDSYILLYTIVIPLLILGIILFLIFCYSRHRRNNNNNNNNNNHHHHHHSPCTDTLKSSIKPRQPLIHHNDVMFPSAKSHTSNDYLADSVDSIPVHRQYQQQRYGPSTASDLASLASSNPYYTRVQAL